MELEPSHENIFISGIPRLFPGLPTLCHSSPWRVSSQQSRLMLSLRSNPQNLSLSIQTSLSHIVIMSVWATSQLGSAAHHDLCGVFFLFCLLNTHCFIAFWDSEALHWPHLWGGFQVCRKFSSLPPRVQVPISKTLCLPFCLYLLSYLILWRFICLFGNLGSSTSFQMFCKSCSICRWVLNVFMGEFISLCYYSAILKVSPNCLHFLFIFLCAVLIVWFPFFYLPDQKWTIGFSSNHVWMWEPDNKKYWVPKNWCLQIVMLEKTLESPWDSKEIKPINSKGNQPWIFIERTETEAEVPILWSPDANS